MLKILSYKYSILLFFIFIFYGCNKNDNHSTHKSNGDDIDKSRKIQFSEEGNIKNIVFFKDSKKVAAWNSNEYFNPEQIIYNYYSNGVLKSKGFQDKNQRLHGRWMYYDRDGNLESDRYYFHGAPDGDWYSYSHGIKKVVPHDHVKGNGVWEKFYNYKIKLEDGSYKDTVFVIESTSFKDNKLNGPYVSKNDKGQIKSSGSYSFGKKNGEWFYYNDSGNISQVENYDNGLLEGDFKHYFENGEDIKIIGQYSNNEKVGDWFWYFDTNQESSYRQSYSN